MRKTYQVAIIGAGPETSISSPLMGEEKGGGEIKHA